VLQIRCTFFCSIV